MRGLRVERKCEGCDKTFMALAIKVRDGKGKFHSVECYKSYRRKNKIDEKEANIFYQKKHKYGLTKEQYLDLFVKQKNACKICEVSFKKVRAYVDHNHITNEVRGLLCNKCNTMLGLALENKKILENAIKYLDYCV